VLSSLPTSSSFYDRYDIWWRVFPKNYVTLIFLWFSAPSFCIFSLLDQNVFPAPCSGKPSIYFVPLGWVTNFCTHAKQRIWLLVLPFWRIGIINFACGWISCIWLQIIS
jgi:hypothetical protein